MLKAEKMEIGYEDVLNIAKDIHRQYEDFESYLGGVKAINGYTVAAGPSLPFGTTIYIEGYAVFGGIEIK